MDFFRRGNSKLVNKDDKTNKNTSTEPIQSSDTARSTSPTRSNDKMADSGQHVKPAYSRDRNSDRGPKVKDVVEQLNTTSRVSPQGPRGIPNSKSGEREPYQTKHFSRSDSVPSITAVTPVKGPRGPDNSYGRRDRLNAADRANYDSSDSFYSPTPKNRHSTPPGFARAERRPMLPDSPLKRQIRVVSRTASDDLRSDALMARPPPPAKLVKAQSQRDDRKHKHQISDKQPIKSSSNNDGSMAPPKPPFIPPGKPANRVISAEMQTWLVKNENVLRKFGSPEKPKLRSKFESLEPQLDKKEKEAFDNFKAMTQRKAASIELMAQEAEAKKRDSADSTKNKRDGIIFDVDMVKSHMSDEARKSQDQSKNGVLALQLNSYGNTLASIFSDGSVYSQDQDQDQSSHLGLRPDSNRNTQASIKSADSRYSQDDARHGGLNSGASSARNTQESYKVGDSRYVQDQNKRANAHLFYDSKRGTEMSANSHDLMHSNDPAKRNDLGSRSQSEKNRQFSGNSNETGYDGDRESHRNDVYRSESNNSSRPGYSSRYTPGNRDFSKLSSEIIQKNKPSIYNETIGKYEESTLHDAASIKSMSPGKERRAMRRDALSRAHIRKPLPELRDSDRPESPFVLSLNGSEPDEARLDQLTRMASSMILNPAPGKEGPARKTTRKWRKFDYPPPDEEPPYVRHTPRMNFEEYHDGYTLKSKVYGLPDSAEIRREAGMKAKSLISPRSRIPTPITSPGSATKRKPVASGLTMGDLGMKMAKEYQKIGDPLYKDTPRSGLPRSFGDVNIAGKLLENPTWEELINKPMVFSALQPRNLTIRKKSSLASIKSNESSIRKVSAESQRLPMDMPPPLRPARNQPNRSASAQQRDWETYYNENDMMTEMHNEIDEYLASLLEERRDRRAQLIKEEAKRAEAAKAAEAGEVAEVEETGTWQKIKTAMRFSNESSPKRASTQSQKSHGRGEMLVDDLIKRLK